MDYQAGAYYKLITALVQYQRGLYSMVLLDRFIRLAKGAGLDSDAIRSAWLYARILVRNLPL